MQIHELQLHTLREAELSEAGLLDLGREVIRNPKALISSRALGAAQQAATQRAAAKLAPAVTNIANANIPQKARQLAAGWPQIAKTLPAPTMAQGSATPNTKQPPATPAAAQTKPTVTPAQPTITPTTKIQGAKAGQPTPAKLERFEKQLQARLAQSDSSNVMNPETFWGKPDLKEDAAKDYRDSFIQYAQRVLSSNGVDVNALRRDEKTNAELAFALQEIVRLANQPQLQAAKVEQYFNTALTAWNQMIADPAMYQRLNPQSTGGTQRQTSVQAGDADQELKQTLSQIGISTAQLQQLAQVATNAAQGNNAFRSTGNPMIDAVLQAAGMRLTR